MGIHTVVTGLRQREQVVAGTDACPKFLNSSLDNLAGRIMQSLSQFYVTSRAVLAASNVGWMFVHSPELPFQHFTSILPLVGSLRRDCALATARTAFQRRSAAAALQRRPVDV